MTYIRNYIQDYSISKIPLDYTLDQDGIPLFDPKKMGWNGDNCYHPTVVIQYGLACWERRADGFEDSFLKCARWVMENAQNGVGGSKVWEIPFPIKTPRIEAPWISALTQAQAISLLIRLFEYEPSLELENCIQLAIKPLLLDLKEGGLLYMKGEDLFLEEAGDIHILNGCLTSLYGLYEYQERYNSDEVKDVMSNVESTISRWLPRYDRGFWSSYSLKLRYNLADLHYHMLHIQQLNTLGKLLNNENFLSFAKKWKTNATKPSHVLLFLICRFIGLSTMRTLSLFKLDKFKYRI